MHPGKTIKAEKVDLSKQATGRFLGATREDSLIIWRYKYEEAQKVVIGSVALRDRSLATHNWSITLPMKSTLEDMCLSPDGTRLCLGVKGKHTISGGELVRSLLSKLGCHDHTTWELWTCNLDGSDMREVGYIDYTPTTDIPYSIQWTPDGKRLSFLLAKMLYTVPAD